MISDLTSKYGIKQYILDSQEDFDNLRTTDKMGSTAYIINDGAWYILNGEKEWKPYFPAGKTVADSEEEEEQQQEE